MRCPFFCREISGFLVLLDECWSHIIWYYFLFWFFDISPCNRAAAVAEKSKVLYAIVRCSAGFNYFQAIKQHPLTKNMDSGLSPASELHSYSICMPRLLRKPGFIALISPNKNITGTSDIFWRLAVCLVIPLTRTDRQMRRKKPTSTAYQPPLFIYSLTCPQHRYNQQHHLFIVYDILTSSSLSGDEEATSERKGFFFSICISFQSSSSQQDDAQAEEDLFFCKPWKEAR